MSEWEEFDFEGTSKKDDNNSIRQFLYKLLANWYWFAICGALGLFVAFVYLRYSTPIYQINAKVLVSDEKKGAGMVEGSMLGNLSGMLGAKSTVDNEVEILKTRDLMEQVVRSLDANITYYKKGSIRDVELYESPFRLILFEEHIPSSAIHWNIKLKDIETLEISNDDFNAIVKFNVPFKLPNIGRVKIIQNKSLPFDYEDYRVRIVSVNRKVAEFKSQLSVDVSNKTATVVNLVFSYPVKRKGELVLRTLIDQYVKGNLDDKNTIADSTIAFIEDRLILVGQELGTVESNIQAFKQKSQLADISTQSQLLLENSSQYVKELAEVETQLSVVKSMEDYLSENEDVRILPSAMLPNDVVFSGLIERYNSLLLERDRKLLGSTIDNPAIVNLNTQIDNLRDDIRSNLATTRHNLSITKNELVQNTQQIDGQIRNVPAKERTYLDLARQQQIKQELYVFLLQKREETAISKTSNISNSKIIDSPRAADQSVSPKKNLTLTFGLVAGLILPFLIIYVMDIFDIKVANKDDIIKRTNVSVIGEISHKDAYESVIITNDSRSALAENFRSLRTNLAFYLNKVEQRVVLLTSSVSGEGKSFIALNLASIIAYSGKKVVVMEMDLRKPKLSEKLNSKNNKGFTSYIIDKNIKKNEIIFPSGISDNLHFISSGPIPPNPSELILDSRTDELMTYLNSIYDYIIIDAPPIGLVTDAQLLSKYSDLSLYVVRQRYTDKNHLRLIDDYDREGKLGKMAVLINDIKTTREYGYAYGYGYYEGSTRRKTPSWSLLNKK